MALNLRLPPLATLLILTPSSTSHPHRDTSREDKLDYLPPPENLTDEEIWSKIPTAHITESFGSETLERVRELIVEFGDLFRPGIVTGTKALPPHRIELKPFAKKASSAPYPEGMGRSAIIRDHVGKMLTGNVIRPSLSPFAAPVVLARKPDGTWRFCVDFRKLNEITVPDKYPLPRIEDLFDTIAHQHIFSSMDLLSGFWQLPVAEEDRHKTAFISSRGLFEFLVMPFGLTNAPPSFQRAMDAVLAGFKWLFCMVYIDDIVVFSATIDEHLSHLHKVFTRLRDYNLKLKPSKLQLFHTDLPFLGHRVSADGIRKDPSKLARLENWPRPTGLKSLQRFLGFSNYFRRFLKNYATISLPLTNLLKKDHAFQWTDECDAAFTKILALLCEPTLLVTPQPGDKLVIECDASGSALGAALYVQAPSGLRSDRKPVAFASRTLAPVEQRYSNTDREGLAVVWAIDTFDHWVFGQPITVETDHQALIPLFKRGALSGRFARWTYALSEYDLTLIHVPGLKQVVADSLSRENLIKVDDNYPSFDRVIFGPNAPLKKVEDDPEDQEFDVEVPPQKLSAIAEVTEEVTATQPNSEKTDREMKRINKKLLEPRPKRRSLKDKTQTTSSLDELRHFPRPPPTFDNIPSLNLCTWNVNGLMNMLKHYAILHEETPNFPQLPIYQLNHFLESQKCSIIALQETRLGSKSKVLRQSLANLQNWNVVLNDPGTGFNGVAIFWRKITSRAAETNQGNNRVTTTTEMGNNPQHSEEGRFVALFLSGLAIVNVYLPNGLRYESRHQYKLEFQRDLKIYCDGLRQHFVVIVLGDLNVAPEPIDRTDLLDVESLPSACTPEETAWFHTMTEHLYDGFRVKHPDYSGRTWFIRCFNKRDYDFWRIDFALVDRRIPQVTFDVRLSYEPPVSDHMRIQLHLFLPDGSVPTRLHPQIPRSLYTDESDWAGETQEFHTFTAISKEIPLFTDDTKELKRLQNEDPYFGPLIQFLEQGTLPLERGDRALLRSRSRLMFLDKEGLLYHVTNPPLRASRRGTPGLALCIPDGLRRRALRSGP